MAAVARVTTIQLNHVNLDGSVVYEIDYYLCDPALQGDGSGHDARNLAVLVTMDVNSPFDLNASMVTAIIADAAAQPQPFTLNNARVIIPADSHDLLEDSYAYNAPATGFSITIGNAVKGLVLDPAGTLATGTITMPGNPHDGRVVKISSSQAVTALTLTPNTGQSFSAGGAVSTLAANSAISYIWRNSLNTWYRWD
jgi:hypothetical protein